MTYRLSAIALIGLALSEPHPTAIKYAWWLTADFSPADKAVEGVPLSAIDSSWVAASALREDMLPPEAKEKGESVAEHGAHFALATDLDGDGRSEKAIVGVYRDKTGTTGRFLLILSPDRRAGMRRKALFVEPGRPGFSALVHSEGTLDWVFCMECDSYCAVVHKDGAWTLDCQSCCEE